MIISAPSTVTKDDKTGHHLNEISCRLVHFFCRRKGEFLENKEAEELSKELSERTCILVEAIHYIGIYLEGIQIPKKDTIIIILQRATVRTVRNAGWFPSLPCTLSEQRYADLIALHTTIFFFKRALHTTIVPCQLSERDPDAWVWRGGRFSVRAVYHHFQGLESTSDSPTILKCCRRLWKCRIPLKIKLFGWLLLRQRLMTGSLQQRFYPDAPVECPLCAGAAEDCSHLFFEGRFAQMAWRATTTCCLVTSSADSFWQSISRGPFRHASEWQSIFAMLWSIWLHRNDVVFKGRPPSVNAIQHDARRLTLFWQQGGLDPSGFGLL